jgi:hypothetical protein
MLKSLNILQQLTHYVLIIQLQQFRWGVGS